MSKTAGRRVRAYAPAKINLTLRVLGVRSDGYHELRTTFQSLALRDVVTVTVTDQPLAIACDDPRVPVDRSNLVWAAAERLWAAIGRPGEAAGVHIAINKCIPMQAGLGGGSSDAAATIRALAELWRVKLDAARIRPIARILGADVSYFFEGGTALGLDRGDVLFPLVDRPSAWVVIVRPDFGVSTRDAYGWWDQQHVQGEEDPDPFETINDLQAPVVARHPEIGRLIKRLERLGAANAAMSGSGSAVFGLFASARAAQAAARALTGRRQSSLVTRTVSRRQYRTLVRAR